MRVDIHQHLWPAALVEELRRRSQPPRLDGWTLITAGEPPFEVDPAHHDAGRRAAQAAGDGIGLAVIGPSSPLGIEYLAPADAERLLDAYHHGVSELGAVGVGRGHVDGDDFPFVDWTAAELGVFGRLAGHNLRHRLPPQELLDRRGDDRRVFDDLAAQVGVLS